MIYTDQFLYFSVWSWIGSPCKCGFQARVVLVSRLVSSLPPLHEGPRGRIGLACKFCCLGLRKVVWGLRKVVWGLRKVVWAYEKLSGGFEKLSGAYEKLSGAYENLSGAFLAFLSISVMLFVRLVVG